MAIDVVLTDAHAQITVDVEIGLEVKFEKASEIAVQLHDRAVAQASTLTNALYGVDGGAPEKAESAVALTLMTLAARLVIAKRISVALAIQDATKAIEGAVTHAREVAKRELAQTRDAA